MRGTVSNSLSAGVQHNLARALCTGTDDDDVLLINVLTELIKLIILALTLPSCICPPWLPKEGSDCEEPPQPTGLR